MKWLLDDINWQTDVSEFFAEGDSLRIASLAQDEIQYGRMMDAISESKHARMYMEDNDWFFVQGRNFKSFKKRQELAPIDINERFPEELQEEEFKRVGKQILWSKTKSPWAGQRKYNELVKYLVRSGVLTDQDLLGTKSADPGKHLIDASLEEKREWFNNVFGNDANISFQTECWLKENFPEYFQWDKLQTPEEDAIWHIDSELTGADPRDLSIELGNPLDEDYQDKCLRGIINRFDVGQLNNLPPLHIYSIPRDEYDFKSNSRLHSGTEARLRREITFSYKIEQIKTSFSAEKIQELLNQWKEDHEHDIKLCEEWSDKTIAAKIKVFKIKYINDRRRFNPQIIIDREFFRLRVQSFQFKLEREKIRAFENLIQTKTQWKAVFEEIASREFEFGKNFLKEMFSDNSEEILQTYKADLSIFEKRIQVKLDFWKDNSEVYRVLTHRITTEIFPALRESAEKLASQCHLYNGLAQKILASQKETVIKIVAFMHTIGNRKIKGLKDASQTEI